MDDLRVLPLRRGTNIPAIRNWQNLATADPAQIEAWRREVPGCNWGIRTGEGVGVLDLDTKNAPEWSAGGFGSLIDVCELLDLDLSHLPMVETFSGAHLYFRYDGTLPSKVPWVDYIDVKADGGHQVAGPGTVREVNGVERVYRVVRGNLRDIPYAPVELIEAIRGWKISRSRPGGGSTLQGAIDLPDTAWLQEHGFRLGERDNGFNALAWKLTRTHYPHVDLAQQIAYEVWLQTDNPPTDPFPWSKVQSQLQRAEKSIGPEIRAQIEWARRRYGQ